MKHADLYADADADRLAGHSIIPIRNDTRTGRKFPAILRWKPYQRRPPTNDEVRRWFSSPKVTGFARVLGPVSGGAWMRDFDIVEAYRRWAQEFPQFAKKLPTIETGRGFQVGAYHERPVRTQDFRDGELRGEGAYSVMPRSIHPSGKRYRWVIGGSTTRVTMHPSEVGLARCWVPDEGSPPTASDSSDSSDHSDCSDTSDHSGYSVLSVPQDGDSTLTLGELMGRVLPDSPNQNHKRLWILARGIKALEAVEGRAWDESEIRERAFLPWYRRNEHLRAGQGEEEYFEELLDAYSHVKVPLGHGVLERVFQEALESDPPRVASQFQDASLRLLVTWCFRLQRAIGDGPFFLSTRSVSSKLGLGSSRRAALFLRALVRSGILVEVEKGGPKTNRATRFRYLGGE